MNRAGEPTISSTATSRRPDSTTIILRLRLPGPTRLPPQAASAPSSENTPLLDSALGVVDAEGELPTSTATRSPPQAASAWDTPVLGVVDAKADLLGASASGDVEGEEEPRSTSHISAGSHPSPQRQGDSTSVVSRADERAVVPPPPGIWDDLFLPDLIRHVATFVRSSRRDLEVMRAVCSSWRDPVPSTIDPFLVLSRKKPHVNSEVNLLKIRRANQAKDISFEIKLPLSSPPTGVSCWGSALGLMALQCQSPNSQQVLVYCAQCGESKELLPLPSGLTPRALYLEPLTPQRFVLLAEGEQEANLHVESDGFPWPLEDGPQWLKAPGFANINVRTMALDPGVVRAGADRDSIVIIDESGRPMDDDSQIMHIQLPPLLLPNGSITSPWEVNGQHLFMCNGKMYLLQIFDSPLAPMQVAVRLLGVKKLEEDEYAVTPVYNIGNYSVYLGPNQSFVLPSIDAVIGRMANTIYIEDYRGSIRQPQALGINIESMSTVVIPYPGEIACTLNDMLPAVWVGLPQQHDLYNHCRNNNCWQFWD